MRLISNVYGFSGTLALDYGAPPSASATMLRRDKTGGGGEGNIQDLDILAGPQNE
ncbi:MAG: hypothetical protein WCP86_09805 [bacterium]